MQNNFRTIKKQNHDRKTPYQNCYGRMRQQKILLNYSLLSLMFSFSYAFLDLPRPLFLGCEDLAYLSNSIPQNNFILFALSLNYCSLLTSHRISSRELSIYFMSKTCTSKEDFHISSLIWLIEVFLYMQQGSGVILDEFTDKFMFLKGRLSSFDIRTYTLWSFVLEESCMDLQAISGVKKQQGCFSNLISIRKSIVGTFINESIQLSPNSNLSKFLSFQNDSYLRSFVYYMFFQFCFSLILLKLWDRSYFFVGSIFSSTSMGIDSMGYRFQSEDWDFTSIMGICRLRPRFLFCFTIYGSRGFIGSQGYGVGFYCQIFYNFMIGNCSQNGFYCFQLTMGSEMSFRIYYMRQSQMFLLLSRDLLFDLRLLGFCYVTSSTLITSLILTFFFTAFCSYSKKDLFLTTGDVLEFVRCRLITSAFYICVMSSMNFCRSPYAYLIRVVKLQSILKSLFVLRSPRQLGHDFLSLNRMYFSMHYLQKRWEQRKQTGLLKSQRQMVQQRESQSLRNFSQSKVMVLVSRLWNRPRTLRGSSQMMGYYSEDILLGNVYLRVIYNCISINPTPPSNLPLQSFKTNLHQMFARQSAQDSYTLDNYIYFIQSHKSTPTEQEQPIESQDIHKIEYFAQRKRKMSTQMSLFSWLVKDKPAQSSLLLTLDKELIIKIYSYLRISEVFIVSSVSSYMYSCYKHLWIDKNFFQQFQTDKFTSEELNKVIEKSKLEHIKQLKQIYLGKNIKKNREKIKMRVTDDNGGKNCMLEVFSISPKIKNGTVFIMDSHLENILNSSYKGLQCIQLHRCPYVKNFASISRCIELQKFAISYNEYVTTQSLSPIFKRCLKLSKLEISQCKNLDQNIFKQVQKVQQLTSLSLRFFKQSFGKLPLLSQCLHLTQLNIDDSLITDDELMAGIRELKLLKRLSIQGCALLTNVAAEFLLQRLYRPECGLREIVITRINGIECQKIQQIEEQLYRLKLQNGPGQK